NPIHLLLNLSIDVATFTSSQANHGKIASINVVAARRLTFPTYAPSSTPLPRICRKLWESKRETSSTSSVLIPPPSQSSATPLCPSAEYSILVDGENHDYGVQSGFPGHCMIGRYVDCCVLILEPNQKPGWIRPFD
ncbi:hypothetical protein LINGRAHAP2_LOCUS24559, partial [Linum grandiflorum]